MSEGKKYDSDKPKMHLLPPKALLEVAKVLTFGAEKYGEENWREVADAQNRYASASLRHSFSHLDKEELDEETNYSHLAHAICCLLFKLELELENEKVKKKSYENLTPQNIEKVIALLNPSSSVQASEKPITKKASVRYLKHCLQHY